MMFAVCYDVTCNKLSVVRLLLYIVCCVMSAISTLWFMLALFFT